MMNLPHRIIQLMQKQKGDIEESSIQKAIQQGLGKQESEEKLVKKWLPDYEARKQLGLQSFKRMYPKRIQYIKALSYLSLRKLQIIDVSGMKIQSIEGLMYVDAQNLQRLWLNWNQITSLKSLSKTKWDQLKKGSFLFNYITSGESLNRVKMSKCCKLFAVNGRLPNLNIEDANCWFKIEAFETNLYLSNDDRRISSQRVFVALKNRFGPNIILIYAKKQVWTQYNPYICEIAISGIED